MSDSVLARTWRAKAYPVLRDLAAPGPGHGFYSDDLVALVGWPDPAHPANSVNGAVGALFRSAGAQGLIRKTGRVRASRQPRRRGGMIQEWEGVGEQSTLPL